MFKSNDMQKMLAAHLDKTEAGKRNQDRIAKKLRPFKTGLAGYRQEVRETFGLSEQTRNNEPVFDTAIQAENAREVDFAEVAHAFLGPKPSKGLIRSAFSHGSQMHELRESGMDLAEAEGATVGASQFSHINAFVDTVGGLIDAMMLEAYNLPQYIGDRFVTTRDARVQGGKRIGVRMDGGVSDSLTLGEPYPTVGLNETYVRIPENQRNGIRIKVREDAFIYDRTDQLQKMASDAGESVRRLKEIRIADVVLGKVNTYNRDEVLGNTYRVSAAGAGATSQAYNLTYPMAYKNAVTSQPLNDWQDLNKAAVTLGGNTDPATGWEIAVNPQEAILLVMPQQELLARTILSASSLQTRTGQPVATQATAITLDVRNHANPVSNFAKEVAASWIWYHRLLLAGVNAVQSGDTLVTHVLNAVLALGDEAAKAQSVWLWGQFNKAFEYRQIVPFESYQVPVSSDDAAIDVMAIFQAREWGVPWVLEPRYVFQGANTYTA